MRRTHRFIVGAFLNQWAPTSAAALFGRRADSNRILPILLSLCVSTALGTLVLLGALSVAALALYASLTQDMPSPEQLTQTQLNQSTRIYDRNGDLLFELFDPAGGRRTLVGPEQIPEVLKQATIATEDATFYSNVGVDWFAMLRALYTNARYQTTVSGASTITQQVVKASLLTADPTFERKIREALLAMEVNRRYSKDEILALYLNTNYYGNLSDGVQAAARGYFNKDLSALNLAEASLLAGLPQSPALYDPCTSPDAVLERQAVVLGLMVKNGYIDDDQSAAALKEMSVRLKTTEFQRQCNVKTNIKAPHFVNYVRLDLERRFGADVVYKGGLQVYTTFDPKVQAIAEEEARKQIALLKDQHVTNAAVVVLKPNTGEIVAMLGSVNFFDPSIDGQVNVADRLRQPGSSIKPVNYVTAFKYGWTPATRILDVKTKFPDASGKPYVPVNYDKREHGLVTARTALASSFNIPAVKALYFTSSKDPRAPAPLAMMQTARQLGITTFADANGNPKPFGLSLTLGGGEIKLIELTAAYAVFANYGTYIAPTAYVKILDSKGNVLYDPNNQDKPKPRCAQFDLRAPNEQPDARGACVASAPYAYLITSILSDDRARALGFGLNGLLKTAYPAAVKTGTTDDFRDNWTLGYSADWVVGVWVGNADNSPMIHSTGITGAAPIWRAVMDRIMQGRVPREFPVPPGIVRDGTDFAIANHPKLAGEVPNIQTLKIDKRNGLLAGDNCPAEFVSSETFETPPPDTSGGVPYVQIVDWAKQNGWKLPPKQTSPLCVSELPIPLAGAQPTTNQIPAAQTTPKPGAIPAPSAARFVPVFQVNIPTSDDEASLRGQVRDRNGRPVAGAQIAIYNSQRVFSNATTGPDGAYEFDGLNAGSYGVRLVSDPNSSSALFYVPTRRRAIVNFSGR